MRETWTNTFVSPEPPLTIDMLWEMYQAAQPKYPFATRAEIGGRAYYLVTQWLDRPAPGDNLFAGLPIVLNADLPRSTVRLFGYCEQGGEEVVLQEFDLPEPTP